MKAAAKQGDEFVCLVHGPTPVLVGAERVLVNARGALRVGDFALCRGAIKNIVTGSPRVLVENSPAARHGDLGLDPGFVMATSPNVMIGEDSAGSEIGASADAAIAACRNAAAGREGGRSVQSYDNCGIESSRQIINQKYGRQLSEDDAYRNAARHGFASPGGSTNPQKRRAFLAANGVESEVQPQTRDGIVSALGDKKGVITSSDAGVLWNNPEFSGDKHAVLVTGAVYDESGKLTHYRVNDTGMGECGQLVPADRFEQSLTARPMNVTKDPVW